MISIGIDVGVKGALASVDEAGKILCVGDLPITVLGKQKWVNGGKLLTMLFAARGADRPVRVFVEYLHALPMIAKDPQRDGETTRGGGAWAASIKGMTLGSVLATLEVARLPYELIMPQKWKRALGLIMPQATYAERKQASLRRARELFPSAPLSRQRDDGRAEALLIAHYGRQVLEGRSEG